MGPEIKDVASLFAAKPKPAYAPNNVDLASPADYARARSLPPKPGFWDKLADAPRYYLGPTGLDQRLAVAPQALAAIMPGSDMMDAAQSSGDIMRAQSPMEAAAAGASMVGALGSMFIPGNVNRMSEGITRFVDDQSGALRLLHGSPNNDLRPEDITVFNPGAKQARGGREYGGFYTTPDSHLGYAQGYAGPTGTVYQIDLPDEARILDKAGDITRLDRATIDGALAEGFAAIRGKDWRGKPEVAIINPSAIANFGPLRPK